MKVQCDVCDRNKASVMCCADEAALCLDCDSRVHAANKLATKHQRISLISPMVDCPRCDICQVFLRILPHCDLWNIVFFNCVRQYLDAMSGGIDFLSRASLYFAEACFM